MKCPWILFKMNYCLLKSIRINSWCDECINVTIIFLCLFYRTFRIKAQNGLRNYFTPTLGQKYGTSEIFYLHKLSLFFFLEHSWKLFSPNRVVTHVYLKIQIKNYLLKDIGSRIFSFQLIKLNSLFFKLPQNK